MLRLLFLGLLLSLPVYSQSPDPVTKLAPWDPAVGQLFGNAIAVSGDTIAIASAADGGNGSVYLYKYDGHSWVSEQKLVAADGAPGHGFGTSLVLDKDLLVVGAEHYGYVNYERPGAAYIYRNEGDSWVEEQRLSLTFSPSVPLPPKCEFGRSIAGNRQSFLVGATGNGSTGECDGGLVFVFRHDGQSWELIQTISSSDSRPNDLFGISVSLSNIVLAVGAAGNDYNGLSGAGAAYVFRHEGDEWVEEQKLTPSDSAESDGFGISVGATESIIVVGSHNDDDLGDKSGSAYVFRFNGTDWIEEQKLLASDGAPYHRFGERVAVSKGRVLIAAPTAESGAVYVYHHDGAQWNEERELTPPDGLGGDQFGHSIEGVGELLLIGSTHNQGTGSVYVIQDSEIFRRGDANGDGTVNGLVDGTFLLAHQFIPGSPVPPCPDSADVDDNGVISGLVDGIYLLNWQFVMGSPAPPAPGAFSCGRDEFLSDDLVCEEAACP